VVVKPVHFHVHLLAIGGAVVEAVLRGVRSLCACESVGDGILPELRGRVPVLDYAVCAPVVLDVEVAGRVVYRILAESVVCA
jgi:hypothetical protein